MFALCMWWLGMFLEALLLLQGLRTKLVSRYPLFYSYILVVFVQDIIRYIAFHWYFDSLYKPVYWATQFLCLTVGCLIIFEIYRIALQEFPGTAKMVRNLLGGAFLLIVARAILAFHAASDVWTQPREVRLELNLRMVQSTGILILVILFLWYGIPLARNLGGILLGYTVFVALSVVELAIIDQYKSQALDFWAIAQPVLYTTVLEIWIFRLWSADRAPGRNSRRMPPNDYDDLARSTSRALEEAHTRLGSAVRP
jgi:hypothetical protein